MELEEQEMSSEAEISKEKVLCSLSYTFILHEIIEV